MLAVLLEEVSPTDSSTKTEAEGLCVFLSPGLQVPLLSTHPD